MPAEKSGNTLKAPTFGSGIYSPVISQITPISQVNKMPHKIPPFTFLATIIPVTIIPITASTTVIPTVWNVPPSTDCLKLKRAILVAGFPTMIWALNRPISAINRPMPTETARFRLKGITLNTAWRMFVRDIRMNKMPSTQTAARAISQVYPICLTTVKAKKAFSPIPADRAKG